MTLHIHILVTKMLSSKWALLHKHQTVEYPLPSNSLLADTHRLHLGSLLVVAPRLTGLHSEGGRAKGCCSYSIALVKVEGGASAFPGRVKAYLTSCPKCSPSNIWVNLVINSADHVHVCTVPFPSCLEPLLESATRWRREASHHSISENFYSPEGGELELCTNTLMLLCFFDSFICYCCPLLVMYVFGCS